MVEKNIKNCKNCPFRWKFFDTLTEEQLEEINDHRFEAHFKKGEIIFKQGSPTSNAIFLIKGYGKIYMEGHAGKDIILGIAKPTGMIAGPGTYVDNRHHYTFSALTDTDACFVDMSIIKKLIHENSNFAEGFLQDISKKSLGTFYKLAGLTQKKMHGRLAEGILYLADQIFNTDTFPCILSRQELGDLTGMTKESVVRILKEFNDDNIIKQDGDTIEITDRKKLERINIAG
jgi:CRP/FNR family transcriptional regulator, polysaccharide utilization system transcription regulator